MTTFLQKGSNFFHMERVNSEEYNSQTGHRVEDVLSGS